MKKKELYCGIEAKHMFLKPLLLKVLKNVLSVSPGAALAVKA